MSSDYSRISTFCVNCDLQVLSWIEDVGLPTIHQQPEIADCLSKAELYLHHFQTGFFSIANVSVFKCRFVSLEDLNLLYLHLVHSLLTIVEWGFVGYDR